MVVGSSPFPPYKAITHNDHRGEETSSAAVKIIKMMMMMFSEGKREKFAKIKMQGCPKHFLKWQNGKCHKYWMVFEKKIVELQTCQHASIWSEEDEDSCTSLSLIPPPPPPPPSRAAIVYYCALYTRKLTHSRRYVFTRRDLFFYCPGGNGRKIVRSRTWMDPLIWAETIKGPPFKKEDFP